MVSKHPPFAQFWGPSEQPDQLRIDKRPLRLASMPEYVASAVTAVAVLPLLAARLALGPAQRVAPAAKDFLGVAVSPDPVHGGTLPALVDELGVRRLLLRVPVWDRAGLAGYRRFADTFRGCEIVIALLQDRAAVLDPARWRADLRAIFQTFAGRVTHVQLPLAPNRTKWGCAHMGDAADLLDVAHDLRAEFPWLRLVGPGVIDFEPVPWLRGLVNARRYRLDVAGGLLYVDHRGSPHNTQYGIFDLARKMFTPSEAGDGFQKLYFVAIQRDPAVVMEHAELARLFAQTLSSETKE